MVARRPGTSPTRPTLRWVKTVGFYAAVVMALIPVMFPYLWMLTSSLRTRAENLTSPAALLFTPTLDNYARVIAENNLPEIFLNSVVVGMAVTGIGLALGLPCAYAIARFRLQSMGVLVLVARMLPGIAMLVPWYIMFARLHLVGTRVALIFSHLSVALPLITWVSIGFFEDLPGELLDAAKVDGCSSFGVFWRVALPLVRPGVAAGAVLAFVHSWNNFLYSLILGGTIKLAPVAVYNMIVEFDPNWGALNAAAVLVTWPVVLLSLPFGKNLVRGLTAGSIRG